jgi:hypothetical protein
MRKLMLSGWMMGVLAVTTICFAHTATAQEMPKDQHPADVTKSAEKGASVYRLEFTVRELEDGKKINSRMYTMSVRDDDSGRIRVGNRIPYNTGKDQFQYFDVGINIDCRMHDHGTYVLLDTSVEISSIVKDDSSAGGTSNPIVRQARSSMSAAITPGKPTVITSLDDVSSNRRNEVEVTATKIK